MKRIFRSIVILSVISIIVLTPMTKAATDDGFQQRLFAGERAYQISRTGLQRVVDFARSRPDLFSRADEQKKGLLKRREKLAIWNTWSSVLNCLAALDAIRNEWKDFGSYKSKSKRNMSFALNHAVFLAEYRYALEFIELTDKNDSLDTILNEAVPELGITSGNYRQLKFRFLNVAAATEFTALEAIEKAYGKKGVSKELQTFIEQDSEVIWNMGKGKGPVMTAKNGLAVVKQAALKAWFPAQKNVAEWMGDTKVHRKGVHLVSEDQIESMKKRLQPGDILVERHEWYLSNMGLPGFWTHAALYVGSPEERRKYFSDPETKAWLKERGIENGDLEQLLKQQYPMAYAVSIKPDRDGHAPRVLEAISEGVCFTSIEYSGASDSIGVIRPRLSKPEKALAIVRGFLYSGRPYDFNFNFDTDSELVCSELVYKAYEPSERMKGIHFPITEVIGHKVSTPNSMVRQFDEQYGSKNAQSDFVLFLDGFEKENRAVESTKKEFRKSWQRPNWHILIQETPVEPADGKEKKYRM